MGVWYSDAHRLLQTSAEKQTAINIVISAYRSIRSPIAYVSMPITTGKRFYDTLETQEVKTLEELVSKNKHALVEQIIKPNISYGIDFADRVAQYNDLTVIAPSVFEAKEQRWRQDEYMFLWFRVIEELAKEMHMSDGWQYSTGGSLEFLRAMEMQFGFINPLNGMEFLPSDSKKNPVLFTRMKNIKVYDEQGQELRIDSGIKNIASAIKDLSGRGFNPDPLYDPLCKLLSIAQACQNPGFMYRAVNFIQPPYEYDWNELEQIAQEAGVVKG